MAQLIRQCKGLPAKLESAQRAGPGPRNPVHATDHKGNRFIAVWADKQCVVYPVGRALARAQGHFAHNSSEQKAFVLGNPQCDPDDEGTCTVLLAVRELDGRLLAAAPACSGAFGAHVKSLRVFDGRDSLLVSCYWSGGDAMGESLGLFHLFDGSLREVLSGTGSAFDLELGDCKRECDHGCRWQETYQLRVLSRGSSPSLELFSPTRPGQRIEAKAEGRAPPGNVQRWAFDSRRGRFVKDGKPSYRDATRDSTCDDLDLPGLRTGGSP